MACKYVKEFDFGPQKTYVKGYARGGSVKAMTHREMESTPTMERRESAQRTVVKAPAMGMKKGGYAGGGCASGYARGGAAKMSKVMGEYKAGELHSGSKSGPVVKDRKQALAIALSEARGAKKR